MVAITLRPADAGDKPGGGDCLLSAQETTCGVSD
jgi:hypothetical protein